MASARTSDDQVKIPNPAILAILDPLHRSLLNNNLQYEQGKYKVIGEARARVSYLKWNNV